MSDFFDSRFNVFSTTRKHRIVFLATLLVVTRLADLVTTYVATPALAHEANPMVAYFGVGWVDFLKWQLACVLLAFLSMLYTIRYEKKLLVKEPGLDLKSYISRAFYGRKWRWANLFFAAPRDRHTALYLLSYTFSRGLILVGIFAATWNASLHYFLNGQATSLGGMMHVFYPLSFLNLPESIVHVVSLPLILAVAFTVTYAAVRPYKRYRESTDRITRKTVRVRIAA